MQHMKAGWKRQEIYILGQPGGAGGYVFTKKPRWHDFSQHLLKYWKMLKVVKGQIVGHTQIVFEIISKYLTI